MRWTGQLELQDALKLFPLTTLKQPNFMQAKESAYFAEFEVQKCMPKMPVPRLLESQYSWGSFEPDKMGLPEK